MKKRLKITQKNMQELNENEDKINKEKDEYEETIEKLLKSQKRDRRNQIILIIIIIILLMFWILIFRLGKIGYQGNKEVIAEPSEDISIKITQGDIDIDKDTKLNIFKNQKFDGEEKIAPRSSGTYKFCVKNESQNDVIYYIKFSDEMKYLVNMKYKLKIDNIYIRGNEENYVGIDELDVENITVLKDSNNIYTLEWYWADNDKADTFIGSKKETQYYTLNLKINASLYHKKE